MCQRVEQLIDKEEPHQIVLIGFAGGLDPSLHVGEVIDVETVMNQDGQSMRLDGGVPSPAPDQEVRDRHYRLLTMDRLIDQPHEKSDLYQRHGASAVDMESFHVAQLAARRAVPLKILRAISDPATTALPSASVRWTKPDGHTDTVAVMSHVLLHPWRLPALARLGRNASLASAALGRSLEQTLQQMA